jgi:hypothetical protein
MPARDACVRAASEPGILPAPSELMAAQAPVKTHCPNCGAKLHRPDLSLCAYCAMPLDIAVKPAPVDDETIQRLKRMREHAQFQAAMAFTPKSREVVARSARMLTMGTALFAAAFVLWLVYFIVAPRVGRESMQVGLGVAAAALTVCAIGVLVARSIAMAQDARNPLLRRPALVVVRRSETAQDGGTTYFFTLRFDDGAEGEFRWPGQGTAYEPLSNGYSGVAYTRGAELVDFRRLA